MRRSLLLVFLLFIGSAVVARSLVRRQAEPFRVESVWITPTTVKTWEPIVFNIRVKFLVLENKWVEVLEDNMEPGTLDFGKFEADDSFEIKKYKDGEERIWEFAFTLRRIDPRKGVDTIPAIAIPWRVRERGRPEEKAELKFTETSPVIVNYVTTITNEEHLDIRDEIDFGSHKGKARIFWFLTFAFMALPFVFLFIGKRKVALPVGEAEDKPIEDVKWQRLTPAVARRRLDQGLKKFLKEFSPKMWDICSDNALLLEKESELFSLIHGLLLAEMPDILWGDGPEQIKSRLETLPAGRRRETLRKFGDALCLHQDDCDSEQSEFFNNPNGMLDHIGDVQKFSKNLSRRSLFIDQFQRTVGRVKAAWKFLKEKAIQWSQLLKEKAIQWSRPLRRLLKSLFKRK